MTVISNSAHHIEASAALADIFGVDKKAIDNAVFSFEKPTADLLSAILAAVFKKGSVWFDAHNYDTGQLVSACFKLIQSPHDQEALEGQYERIRDVLELLGRDDVDQFPLVKQKSAKQLNLAEFSASIGLSDVWIAESERLLRSAYSGGISLDNQHRLGLLCLWLTLACGVSSKGEVVITLRELAAKRVRTHQGLYWTSGCYEKRRGERRRQWLTEDTVLLAQSIDWADSRCDLSVNFQAIRDALISLKKLTQSFSRLNQRALFGSGLARGFMLAKLPAFAIEYMRGEISSSSLDEKSLARILGRSSLPIDSSQEGSSTGEHLFDDKRFDPPQDSLEKKQGLSASERSGKPPLTELSKILSSSSADAKKQAQAFISSALMNEQLPLIEQILEWAQDRLQKNAPRTVKLSLDHLHSRLLPVVPDFQQIDDPDQWSALVEEVTGDLEQRDKALSAMSSFASYLSKTFCEEFESAGRTAHSGINAQFVTPDELKSALVLLERRLDPELFKVARALTDLGYGAGLRRSEADGLRVQDLELGNVPVIRVIKHLLRLLKTTNAKRIIPLEIADSLSEGLIGHIQELMDSAGSSESLIFNQHGHQCLTLGDTLFNEITKALQEVCGEKKVKYHSLRHSFCGLLLLALLYKQSNLQALKAQFPFFETVEDLLPTIQGVALGSGTVGRFELSTVRCMMGHLSESTTLLHYFHWLDLIRFAGFSRPEASIHLSLQARCGAAGLKQNSRGRGAKIANAAETISRRLASASHALPEKQASAVAATVEQFEQSFGLLKAFEEGMELAQKISQQRSTQPAVPSSIDAQIEQSIIEAMDWVERVFQTGSMAKDLPKPYARLSDEGAISCQQALLASLASASQQDLLHLSEELCWLAEHRCAPYVTYRFEEHLQLQRGIHLLEVLFDQYPIRFRVIAEKKQGKKFVTEYEIETGNAHQVVPVDGARYRLSLRRGDSRFPHRAITWVTIALRIYIQRKISL